MSLQELLAHAKEKHPDCEVVAALCKVAHTAESEAVAAIIERDKAIYARDQVYLTLRTAVEKARMRANGAWLKAISDEEAEVAERIMARAGHKPESPATEGKGWMEPLPGMAKPESKTPLASGDHHGPNI